MLYTGPGCPECGFDTAEIVDYALTKITREFPWGEKRTTYPLSKVVLSCMECRFEYESIGLSKQEVA